MRPHPLFAVLVICLSPVIHAQQEDAAGKEKGVVIFKHSTPASIVVRETSDEAFILTRNIEYSKEFIVHKDKLVHALARKITTKKETAGQESSGNASITMDFFVGFEHKSAGRPKPTFSIHCVADEIELKTDFYLATQYECCGAENTYRLYDLNSNRRFLHFSGRKPYYLEVTSSGVPQTLFIGYIASYNLGDEAEKDEHGRLILSTQEGVRSQVVFKPGALAGKLYDWTPGISFPKGGKNILRQEGRELSLVSREGGFPEVYGGFKVLVTFDVEDDKKRAVSVPVVNGRFFGKKKKVVEIEKK